MGHISAISGFISVLKDITHVMGYRYGLLLLLVTITGLVEGVSLASVIPLLSSIGVGSGGLDTDQQGFMANIAVRFVSELGMQPTVTTISAFVLTALFISTLLYLLQSYVGAHMQTEYVYFWQRKLTHSIFSANWAFFTGHRQGDLVNAFVTEAPRLGGAFYQCNLMVVGLIHGIIYLGVAALISGPITLIILLGGAMLFIIARPLIRRAYATGKGILENNSELQSIAGEMVRNIKSLKATATEPEAVEMLQKVSGHIRHHNFRHAFDIQLSKGVFDFGAASMIACTLYASSVVLDVEPAMTLVVLAIFVRLLPKLTGLQQGLQSISVTVPSLMSLYRLLDDLSVAKEPRDTKALPSTLQKGPLGIAFDNVTLEYDGKKIIDQFSLDIHPGECIALVGASGAGKTSLVDAILGLTPVASGAVYVNEVPLSALPVTSFRQRIGYMGQEITIYNTTIRRNVLWNHPDANDSDYTRALQDAASQSFISKLEKGDETYISNSGAKLSGGEKQRLSLARALLGSPGLLILDEATSALDAETEAMVSNAIREQTGKLTIIMITHRLTSAKIADRICVLDKGKIAEIGSWDELNSLRDGLFRKLYKLQME